MKSVTVAAYNSLAEAESLKKRLVAAGIPAEIHQESKFDEELDFSRVNAGVRVEVPRKDFETALRIAYDSDAVEAPETAAPGQLESVTRAPAARKASGQPSPPHPGSK